MTSLKNTDVLFNKANDVNKRDWKFDRII